VTPRPLPPDPRPRAARALKRAIDLTAGSALLLLAAPVLGLACVAIRVESRGSPIYRHRRVGKDGVEFDLLKLRTMVSGAERIGAGLAVDEGDPRITRVGVLLRRFSLDELPNLVNVLRGEMSLVGPRPTVQVQVSQYSERQLGRLSIEPGITGWAQVKGRAALPWHERIELDLWYIEHWSLSLDARILAETVRLLLTGQGLYRGPTGGWRPPPSSGP
jgi:lipopolysaccharide/colanic/teichoic acid biosynthesis glycosyltransferase